MKNKKYLGLIALWLTTSGAVPAYAGPFEVAVSPSRLELAATTGQRLGQSLDIQNVGKVPTELIIRTLDWSYSNEGQITYHDALIPNSCRPWVTLEKASIKLNAQAKRSFRFQVQVPPNALRTECRFMVAIEGKEPATNTVLKSGGASLSMPVSGRIAVAVYVAVGGAEPKLSIQQLNVQTIRGQRVPVVLVKNQGDAHGRLEGALDASDTKGQDFELAPESTPILPGQTRTLMLTPQAFAKQKLAPLTYPVHAKGSIDWDKGSFKINNAVFK